MKMEMQPDYEMLYHFLFSAMTDALELLKATEWDNAAYHLSQSLEDAECLYLEMTEG